MQVFSDPEVLAPGKEIVDVLQVHNINVTKFYRSQVESKASFLK